ncbi:methionine--tRNA ligase [Candidatus Peregrinibacteria bacterium CG_4_10_14_0_2_um_filter_43_11]|nr:MAG: methionine--tRNA ligase [Candidatus Peregrinibacteria bacterium CG_4_10_14_0_2_um_filter_43_11]
MDSKTFYITTAIVYVNGDPHVGFAMECIQADTIARYKRLMGFDTRFLTGTDENGIKNYEAAQAAGLSTQEFVDRQSKKFQALKSLLNLSNDDFIRTTDQKRHWPACQNIWKKMVEKGDIYKKEYEGRYCSGCEKFLTERDLEDGICVYHKKEPKIVKEENYFFKLSRYSDQIMALLKNNELRIYPEFRKNEILNLAEEGLHDVSFSRPRSVLPWGVPVPDDPKHVMYVWSDALTNYISAIDYAEEGELFHKYWPADLHVIGKDIIRFHAGIWIGMLLSAGVPLPKGEFVHGFITHNGEKMSKSLGNVVDPHETVEKYGLDAVRYYLLSEIPVGNDGDFNDALFVERYNSHLANSLGNLLNRVHTLISRNAITDFDFDHHEEMYRQKTDEVWKKYVSDMDEYKLHEGLADAWELVDFANKRMEEEKPWNALKTEPEKGRATLCNLLEVLRHISILISPFVPNASKNIRNQIGLPPVIDPEKKKVWGALAGQWSGLGEVSIIFPRIETFSQKE